MRRLPHVRDWIETRHMGRGVEVRGQRDADRVGSPKCKCLRLPVFKFRVKYGCSSGLRSGSDQAQVKPASGESVKKLGKLSLEITPLRGQGVTWTM